MQSQPVRVFARVRKENTSTESCLEFDKTRLTVAPYFVSDAHVPERRQSLRRSSVGAGNRKSSIGCSSLIPRTPHTPRGLLRNVLSTFPVMEEAAAKPETFQVSGIIPEDGTQGDVFNLLVADVQAVLEGFRSTVLTYGVSESGKSYTLWGTEEEKGFVCRSLEYIFAHAPEGSSMVLSFIGLDDKTCMDYMNEGADPNECELAFKEGVDGGMFVQKATNVTVSDATSAWNAVVVGLSKLRSDMHQILTMNMHIPCADGSSLVGTLQVAEITLPEADQPVTRNISTLHDVVRGLVDKHYAGSVNYSNAPLTTMLQPAFGGNSRTVLLLNIHSTLTHYHHTIQTLSFGEHCIKLKNVLAPVKIRGISAAVVASDAPAEMVRQVNEFRKYAEDLEAENEELRDKIKAWEDRMTDGDRRQQLSNRRIQESFQTKILELEKDRASTELMLQQERLVSSSQVLIIASLQAEIAKLRQQNGGLAEADQSKNSSEVDNMLNTIKRLQAKVDDLNAGRAVAEENKQQESLSATDKSALVQKEKELRSMREEMRIKEQEMMEREETIQELEDKVAFLKSQVNTINFLKASVTNMRRAPAPVTNVSSGTIRDTSVNFEYRTSAQKPKRPGPSEEAKAAAKAKAKAQAEKKRKAEEERARREAELRAQEEEERRLREEQEEEERRAQEAERRRAAEAAKRAAAAAAAAKKKKAAPKPLAPPPLPVVAMIEEEEEEEEQVQDEPTPVVVPVKKASKKIKAVSPVAVNSPMPALKVLPPKKAASAKKKRVASPNENDVALTLPEADEEEVEPEQKKGRKKLYNAADKKTRKGQYRNSLAPTPGSAVGSRRNKDPFGKLNTGASSYNALLNDILQNNAFSTTPVRP